MPINNLVIGIGSNLGNCLSNLRGALHELKKIGVISKVSSIYESEALLQNNSPKNWNQGYLNAACMITVSDFDPATFLRKLKSIEQKFGIRSQERWAPRHLDLDILYWKKDEIPQYYDLPDLKIPHVELLHRPFALLPLLEILPEVAIERPEWLSSDKKKPFNTKKSLQFVWPKLVGIVNLTPDSFSDGNEDLNTIIVSEQIEKLLSDGAQVIDFGAQSTRPGAIQLTAEQEWQRFSRFMPTIISYKKKFKFELSLDTYRPLVAENFFDQLPWDYLNDVEGLSDSSMVDLLKKTNRKAFVMHSLGIPPMKNKTLDTDKDPINELINWWQIRLKNLLDLGINETQLVFDPGIGFGKTADQSFFILQNLEKFYPIRNEILIGHSRKSFLTQFANKSAKDRDPETAQVTRNLNQAFVQYLRIHDISSQIPALIGVR